MNQAVKATSLVTIELTQVKETKNMVRFEKFPGDDESNRRATIPNLYVQKTALAAAFNGFPQKIKVTIEVMP